MPKGAEKGCGRRGGRLLRPNDTRDFTVYDFCERSNKFMRRKKGDNKMCVPSVINNDSASVWEDNQKTWFEKDLSEFDSLDAHDCSENKDESTQQMTVKVSHTHNNGVADSGDTYPFDFWCVVGGYIRPEDVGRFAAICRYSHAVTHTANFWRKLYLRYYSPTDDLDPKLQPYSIRRVHGLRCRVVRALYQFYPPFLTRMQEVTTFSADPDRFVGMRLTQMWYEKVKQMWCYYFQFQTKSSTCPLRVRGGHSLMSDADLYHNPHDGRVVLQVISQRFISLPPQLGRTLVKTFVSVGHGMRYHKLKMIFGPNHLHFSKAMVVEGNSIVVDPVINLHILHWWDARYP